MKTEVDAPCVKCGLNVFYVYPKARRCVACSNQRFDGVRQLKARVQELESTLKVIDTWARFDLKNGRQYALTAKDVVKLCRAHF